MTLHHSDSLAGDSLGRSTHHSDRRPINNISFVRGSTEIKLSTETISEMFTNTVNRFPDRDAAVFCQEGIRWTWKELSQHVEQTALGLLALGVAKGDRIAIWAPNRPEWLVTQLAVHAIGGVLVNLNPRIKSFELEQQLNQVGVSFLICAASSGKNDLLESVETLIPNIRQQSSESISSERCPDLKKIICLDSTDIGAIIPFASLAQRGATIDPWALSSRTESISNTEPVDIQFTSGTTGRPKAATLTHENIVNNARFVAQAMNLSEHDRLCIPVPLFHCFGMVLSVLSCIDTGACMVFPSRTFDAGNVMEAISNESCTAVHGVPTMFISQLNHPDFHKHDFTQLRTGIMAGASCPVEIMRRLEKEMSLEEITIAYGMTETGPVSFQSDAEDSAERRATTVGRIAPHAEAKIVDTEGNIVSVGEQGELWVKSYSVMAGYWGDSVKTAEVLEGGWMKTGDLATLDEEGYCKIVGRIKDMINRGGEKISPNEIEEFLMKHPDVASAQVFGIPHQRLGEEVCAWIIPKTGATLSKEQITQYCQRSMALEKTPVHIRFVEEFPLTASGKPQKFVMQDEMKSELAKDQFV